MTQPKRATLSESESLHDVASALQNLDEVWSIKSAALPETDPGLPLVIRNFISAVRRMAS